MAVAGAAGTILRAVQIGVLLRLAGVSLVRGGADAALALARTLPFLGAGYLTGYLTHSIIAETTVLTLGGFFYYAWAVRADAGMEVDDGPRTTDEPTP